MVCMRGSKVRGSCQKRQNVLELRLLHSPVTGESRRGEIRVELRVLLRCSEGRQVLLLLLLRCLLLCNTTLCLISLWLVATGRHGPNDN